MDRIEREVIARGVFTSVPDLARKLMRYIRAYSKTARPFNWKYSDVRHRVQAMLTNSSRQATRLSRNCLSLRAPMITLEIVRLDAASNIEPVPTNPTIWFFAARLHKMPFQFYRPLCTRSIPSGF